MPSPQPTHAGAEPAAASNADAALMSPSCKALTPRAARASRWMFWIVVILLGGGAAVQSSVQRWLEVAVQKLPLYPRRALGSMDREGWPYRFVRAEALGPESIEALGTEMYLWWALEDPRRAADDPLRAVNLFITYYTGGPELAVHRPEECFAAAGYAASAGSRTRTRKLEGIPSGEWEVPLRLMTFRKTGLLQAGELSVAYTFFCNGRFTADHRDIRYWSTSLRARHAFFSKVEISFGLEGGARTATAEETEEGACELMRYLLPRLMKDVWPDFEEAEQQP